MASAEGHWALTTVAAAALAAAAFYAVHAAYDWSDERIAANERARVVARLNSVLEPALRGRDLTTTLLAITDPELLGADGPIDVFVLTDRGAPMATVFATVAPHGYNAAIDLLIGVAPIGTITGVRVVRHRETQGLGDAIDTAKSDWMLQFDSTALTAPPLELWAIDQDKGSFDAISGATVTSRAVVAAVKNTLLYFERHRDELYARAAETAARGRTNEP
ncbi:MAG TPA: RnfABCDGE type electron transport complex subunit G [Gammaproteobacteria bacterium]|nr:RnfABCDGE type electron transport complex subunit G [Gammaproteobacteria bacterium]